MFVNQEFNQEGIYAIKFYINGQKRIVYVDDLLPVMPGTDTLAFARSMEEGEFWICLMEKAWAKLHGSYSLVVGGTPN